MKRIAFCFDGTWNRIDGEYPTNVARIAQSVSRFDDEIGQLIYYDEGVGTSRTEKWTGGIFGHGLIEKIIEAYHFLVLNYEPGDELYVFGFSRGAFAARSFIGLIRNCGIMSRRSLTHIRAAVDMYVSRDRNDLPGSEKSRVFRLKHCPKLCLSGDREWRRLAYPDQVTDDMIDLRIAYLGVWDTVGALGIPAHLKLLGFLNRKYAFHDTKLSRFVRRARHAVAVDERRRAFEPALWTNLDDLNAAVEGDSPYEQSFFPGVHSAVGGGGPIRGLSDGAFEWVFRGAQKEKLRFDGDPQSPLHSLCPDHRAQLHNTSGKTGWSLSDRLMGVGLRDRSFSGMDRQAIHPSLARRYLEVAANLPERSAYRPPAMASFWSAMQEIGAQSIAQRKKKAIEIKSAGDERALQCPSKVRRYCIQPGDTLHAIAQREMGGNTDEQVMQDLAILALHNRNIGLIFEDDLIYPGNELEIPEYPVLAQPAPPPAAAVDPTTTP